MSEDQELFDRSLLRRRRARFAGETAEHEFLLSHVAAEIAERIGAILRDFPLALDLGAYHGVLGRAVAALPSVGEMIYAESVPALAARLPAAGRGRATRSCCRSRRWSLNLVVSGLALHRVNDLPGALIQIRRALRPDGLFMGAALGSRSLQRASPGADRGRSRAAWRGQPACRALRRCARVWRAAPARGLRASGHRRRASHRDLSQPTRADARDQGARRRQRA